MKKIITLAMATLLGLSFTMSTVACGENEPPAHIHTFGEWSITEATCTTDGEKVRVCTVCEEEERETLPSTLKYIGWGAFSAGLFEESIMTSATFNATSGWTVTNGVTTKNLSSADLSDKSLAAKMLTKNPQYYLNYTWTRN